MEVYENTWRCGELKLYFSPSAGGQKKRKKNVEHGEEPLPEHFVVFNVFKLKSWKHTLTVSNRP